VEESYRAVTHFTSSQNKNEMGNSDSTETYD